jgi:hypothetical protein
MNVVEDRTQVLQCFVQSLTILYIQIDDVSTSTSSMKSIMAAIQHSPAQAIGILCAFHMVRSSKCTITQE